MATADDPDALDPPPGSKIVDVIVDSAEYLDGLETIANKYPPGFFEAV